MYYEQTDCSSTVHALDAAGAGRVLVIDDDRAFGRFMVEALESRGHDVDWAGSFAGGVASLHAAHYDLVIIDLLLPDGSGLQLLRDVTDLGLLADSSAIILTGRDFEAPADIRVFRKGADVDAFLDRMRDIVAATKRRRNAGGSRVHATARSAAPSDRRQPREKIELVLYTSAESEKCQRALRAIEGVLERYDAAQVRFRICDLSRSPERGEEDAVVFTPTLVKRGPGPRTWIIGNLENQDLLIDLLEVSGVERRRRG
jgi:ActR/RegA family two-component response regulator